MKVYIIRRIDFLNREKNMGVFINKESAHYVIQLLAKDPEVKETFIVEEHELNTCRELGEGI